MDTRQIVVCAAALVTCILALIAFALRFLARRLQGVRPNWSDYLVSVSFLCAAAYTVLIFCKLHYGLGIHFQDLRLQYDEPLFFSVAKGFFRLLWIDMWIYTFAIGLTKLAALAWYWRVFPQSSIRVPIQVLGAFVVAWMLVRIVVICALCTPVTKFWHPEPEYSGHCHVRTNTFLYASTIPHLIIETAIVALPYIEVWKLMKLRRVDKIAAVMLFAFGTSVCALSLCQIIFAGVLDTETHDLWWVFTPQSIAAVCEVNLGHFSTSLSNLRPCFDLVTGRKTRLEIWSAADRRRGSTRSTQTGTSRETLDNSSWKSAWSASDLELARYGGAA